MASKPYSVASAPGSSAYVITRRRSDGWLVGSDGVFAAAPATPYLALAEHAVIKGLYERAEAQAVWANCEVTNFYYAQTGATPAPSADVIIAVEDWAINNDTANDHVKIVAAALAGKTTGAGTVYVVFRDISDTRDAIAGTLDTAGNRVNVVLGGV